LEPEALVERLRSSPGATGLPDLDQFDLRNDLHLDAAASELLQHFHRTNDAASLSLVFELTHPRMLEIAGYITARFALAIDADDLVSSFMARLFTDTRRPQPVIRRFLGLAHTSMRNDALNQLRSHTRSRRRMLEFEATRPLPRDPARIVDEREQSVAFVRVGVLFLGLVWECFHDLKERDRRVLLAREVDGMTYAEVALALSLPDDQVGMVLRRARKRLARRIGRALTAEEGGGP
jgi:RNA polymerase sigma factor (sigma-70 family)